MSAHSKAKTPLHAAGMHLAGVKRLGTPEQIKQAEHAVAALWLDEDYVGDDAWVLTCFDVAWGQWETHEVGELL